MQHRLKRLRTYLAEHELDAILVRDDSDLFWLTGLAGPFDGEAAHLACITSQSATLHTDSRYINAFEARAAECPGWVFTTEPTRGSVFAAASCKTINPRAETLRVGVDDRIPLAYFRALEKAFLEADLVVELVETSGVIVGLRAMKDDDEITALKRAQAVTDAAFTHICEFMERGMTEAEVALELEFYMRKLGAEALAFPSIVAAGENGASPHAQPGDRVLKDGDMVVMDFGARVGGYCSDMTRMVCFGRPSAEQQRVHETVLKAQRAAESAIRAGVLSDAIHNLAAKVIEDAGYGGFFGHALGHGVGIDVHENPVLSPFSATILSPGSVVTVEPGIYLPGRFGVRIEDFGVVTEDGYSVFTESDHSLVVL